MTVIEQILALLEQIKQLLLGVTTTTTAPPVTTTTTAAPVQPVTRDTPFRQTPVISAQRMCDILRGFPLEGECQQIHAALGGRALAVAQSWLESAYGRSENAQLTKNALGLMDYSGKHPVVMIGDLPLRKFNTWAEGFAEWNRRMTDPNYPGGGA